MVPAYDARDAKVASHARVARTSEGPQVRTECRAVGQIVTMEAGDTPRAGTHDPMPVAVQPGFGSEVRRV
jgi:hypothetical protein